MTLLLIGFMAQFLSSSYIEYIQGYESFPEITVSNTSNSALSHNDQTLYVVNEVNNLLRAFHYNAENGHLSFLQEITDADVGLKFDSVRNIKVHPNNQWVYTINQTGSLILKFDRAPGGALTIDNAADTDPPNGSIARDLLISDNGVDMYVGNRTSGALYHYKINQSNGHLSLQTTYANGDMSGGNTITTLVGVDSYWLSEDQNYLYITTFNGNSVLVFSRDVNGNLTYQQKVENNFGGISDMEKTTLIVGYTVGNESYVVLSAFASGNYRLFAFSRNTVSGQLTYLGKQIFSSVGKLLASTDKGKIYFCNFSESIFSYSISSVEVSPFVFNDLASQSLANGCGGMTLSSDETNLIKVANGTDKVVTYHLDDVGLMSQLLLYPPAQIENFSSTTSITSANNSPHVYVASALSSSVNTFFRENDGTLTHMESFVYVDDGGVSGFDGLTSIYDLAITDDGLHVYTAGFGDQGIGVYVRNNNELSQLYGLLSFNEITKNGVNGVTGLSGVYSLSLSNDVNQNYLYATSLFDNAVTSFSRNVDGTLNQIQTITNASHTGELNQPSEIHINSDNTRAYVVSFAGHAIFEYNINNGLLSHSKTLDDAAFGLVDNTFQYPASIAVIDAPGQNYHNSFFVFGENNDQITFIQRDDMTGNYEVGPSYSHPELLGLCDLVLSPNQDYLHASCRDSDVVKTFQIKADFSLAPVSIFTQQQNLVIGIDQPGTMKYSYDGEYLYVPGYLSNGFAVFKPLDDFIFASGFDK